MKNKTNVLTALLITLWKRCGLNMNSQEKTSAIHWLFTIYPQMKTVLYHVFTWVIHILSFCYPSTTAIPMNSKNAFSTKIADSPKSHLEKREKSVLFISTGYQQKKNLFLPVNKSIHILLMAVEGLKIPQGRPHMWTIYKQFVHRDFFFDNKELDVL